MPEFIWCRSVRVLSVAVALSALVTAGAACRTRGTQQVTEPPKPFCGDGHLDDGEECDGSSLGPATCSSLGFENGMLSCGTDCKLITSGCQRRCGNGALDTGEICDGTLGVPPCATFGYRACSPKCELDDSHCVSVPFATAPSLSQPKGGPAVIADLPPKGFGDLVMVQRDSARLATFPYTVTQGFQADRLIRSESAPQWPAAGDFTGDGHVDLAAINMDGSADRFVFTGDGYALEPLPASDGGCGATAWLGAGRTVQVDAGGSSILAAGCVDSAAPAIGFHVWAPGVMPTAPTSVRLGTLVTAITSTDFNHDGLLDVIAALISGQDHRLAVHLAPGFGPAPADLALTLEPTALAAADFDGDGATDVAVTTATGDVTVLQNTGAALAAHGTFTSAQVFGLTAVDFDLDGRVDLAWFNGADSKIQLRRNLGNWTFAPFELTTPAGSFVSLAQGDAEGDGDPDLALTLGTGGTTTLTAVFVNKVR